MKGILWLEAYYLIPVESDESVQPVRALGEVSKEPLNGVDLAEELGLGVVDGQARQRIG